jgi:membrane protease YdiL (CAAX protease family)
MHTGDWWRAVLARHRWLPFVMPLAVYLVVGSLEPTSQSQPGGASIGLAIPYSAYPLVYTAKIALTLAAIALVFPTYIQFKPRVGIVAAAVGVVGGGVWIALCRLQLEQQLLQPVLENLRPAMEKIGLGSLLTAGQRPGFNPLEHLAHRPGWAWGFLAIRLFGLVAVVPLVEEFFYRGFLMRFVVRADWWNVPPGTVNAAAIVLAIVVPMAMHPGELIAAAVWFGAIAWLYGYTKSIWDCVAAHALTNLVLGGYVLASGQWRLM